MLQKLLDISRRMAQQRALAPLLAYTLQAALELFGAERGALALLREDGTLDLYPKRERSEDGSNAPPEPIRQAILDRVIAQREPLLIAGASCDPVALAFAPSWFDSTEVCASVSAGQGLWSEQALAVSSRDPALAPRWPAFMCVPLISRGHVLGALYLAGRPHDQPFGQHDLQALLSLAAQAAVAIHNATLNEQREAELQALREIRQALSQVRALEPTGSGDDGQVPSAIQAGATGYLLKGVSPEELVDAIRCVRCRQRAQHPSVTHILAVRRDPPQPAETAGDGLSARDVQVLKLLARGLSNPAIAEQLHISQGTVRYHVGNILSKLNLENRTQAALYALREGLASLED